MTDDKKRWERGMRVRFHILAIMRDLNGEQGAMTNEGEPALMRIAHEMLHVTPPGVAGEHVAALGRLYDEMREQER